MKSYRGKRFLSFIISIIMIFGSLTTAFANENIQHEIVEEKVVSKEDIKENNDNKIIEEDYPLSSAFLNRELETASDKSEHVYIVQFEDGEKEDTLKELEALEGLEIKYEYDSIFEGVSLKCSSEQILRIRDLDGVKNIQKNGSFVPNMAYAMETTKIKEAVNYAKELNPDTNLDGRGTVVAVIDSGIDIGHEAMRLDEDAKPFIKVKPREGFTDKVPHGFSYVGGGPNLKDNVFQGHGMHCAGIIAGNSETFKGVAPNAQIFAYRIFSDAYYGDDNKRYEYGGDDAVYHAIDDAVKNGADVISMSIGQAGDGYIGDLYYETVNRAAEQGVVLVSAIGNYSSSASSSTFDSNPLNNGGLTDTSAMTYYAGIGKMLAVGSTTNEYRDSYIMQLDGESYPYVDLGRHSANERSMESSHGKDVEIVYVGHGRPSAYRGKDVAGKIALVRRDGAREKGSTIIEKIQLAGEKGALGIIIMNSPISYSRDHYKDYPIAVYDNNPEMAEEASRNNMWAISVNGEDGEKLISLAEKGGNLRLEFPKETLKTPWQEGIRLSGFSGWGPNGELELKPEVVAPGENIYSTMNRSKYGHMSGTSMATPHVAGISALLTGKVQEVKKNPSFANMINSDVNKLLLMNTAHTIKDTVSQEGIEVSPRRQGAGIVDAAAALKNQVIISHNQKGAVELKDFQEDIKSFKIRLDNISNQEKTYQVKMSNVLGESVLAIEKAQLQPKEIKTGDFLDEWKMKEENVTVPIIHKTASISADKELVKIPANSTSELTITLKTEGIKDSFVEGFIYLDSQEPDKTPHLSIPYFGYKGDWGALQIFDKPMWDKDSIFGMTTVLGVQMEDDHGEHLKYWLLGVDPEKYPFTNKYEDNLKDYRFLPEGAMVEPDKISISTGGYAMRPKVVVPRITALREVRDLQVSILDSEEKPIRRIASLQNFRKNIYNRSLESSYGYKIFHEPNTRLIWDGKLYDPGKYLQEGDIQYDEDWNIVGYMDAYGEYYADPGQYYYEIKGRVTKDGPFQRLLLPFKIDNVRPIGVEGTWKTLEGFDPYEYPSHSRDFIINIHDDNGLMFVGASLDNKTLEVENLGNDQYLVKDIKINELTKSTFRIEAMDYATNLMEPIVMNLNDNYLEIENYEEILRQETDILKARLENEKVFEIEAYQGQEKISLDRIGQKYEMKIDPRGEDLRIIGKDQAGKIIGEELISLSSKEKTNPKFEESWEPIDNNYTPGDYFGALDYEEMDDELANSLGKNFSYGILNYHILGRSSDLLNPIPGVDPDYMRSFKPSGGWYFRLENYDSSNYKLDMKAYNTRIHGYQAYWEWSGELDRFPSNTALPVYNGTNILSISLIDKATDKIVFSRGSLFMIDLMVPIYIFEGSFVDQDKKVIYANDEKITLIGSVEDNLDELYLEINGDAIVSKQKQGDFDNTRAEFEYELIVKDGDAIRIRVDDRFGNYEVTKYDVVMDKEAPKIKIDFDGLNEDSILKPIITDNIGLRETIIRINDEIYQENTRLGDYTRDGKLNIKITAVDRAGNLTELEENLQIQLTNPDSDPTDEEYTIIVEGGRVDKEKAKVGEIVTIIADSIEGKEFKGWKLEPAGAVELKNEARTSFIMGDIDIKITAIFEELEKEVEDDLEEIVEGLELKQRYFLAEELSIDNLFDLPEGVTIKIKKKIDTQKPGDKEIEFIFYKGEQSISKKYIITLLPELSLSLKTGPFKLYEIDNVYNIVEANSNFTYSFVKAPEKISGIQIIEIKIEDKYGNIKIEKVKIKVVEENKAPDLIIDPEKEEYKPYHPDEPHRPKPRISNFEEAKYEPVGEAKEEEYKTSNTVQASKKETLNDIGDHWARGVIEKAVKESIVTGYPDGSFKPDKNTSRSEFVSIANRLFKLKGSQVANFKDVDFGAWYYKDLRALVEAGIINGYEDKTFKPNSSISREEILSIIIRYIEKERPELLDVEMNSLAFIDEKTISLWAREDVEKAYSLGLVNGDENNMLNPKKEATRAEVVQMIYNLKDLLER